MRLQPAGRIAPRNAAVGALALGTTLSVTALAFAQATPAPESSPILRPPAVQDATLRLGQRADVRGHFAASDAGRQIALQYAARGARWRAVATTTVEEGGRYHFRVRLKRSGALRITLLSESAPVAGGGTTAPAPGVIAAEAAPTSSGRRIAVAGRLVVGHRGHDVQAGEAVHVRGTLLPRTRGRRLVVEAGSRGRWHAVAHARTRANGHFDARVATHTPGSQRLRVRFAGDRRNAGTRRGAGTLQTYRASLASWYGLYGGALACGGTLAYDTQGVANKYLPCGTKVTLRYRGREVTVPVIDRGPYVGGREWDLTGATARSLGFDGVGVVWTTK
ncbi:MAG TPA: septal ring lytic transglycosylase RlpA family protein [Conexibacter sp.]|nr:septal ring lytic transglycosylase RlpA family protein [Conexibacter sp.]